jgi:CRISPR-associated protein Cmr2
MAIARKLPTAMDRLRSSGSEADGERLEVLEAELAKLIGHRHETYYGVILMDGDRMGAWLAGNDGSTRLKFRQTWHPQIRAAIARFEHEPALREYFDSYRPASPARHAFVSAALNQFSLHVARHVVERIGKGRLIYSGGDDVLALVAVDDLLPVMLLLRAAYSGWGDPSKLRRDLDLRGLQIGRGFVRLDDRVLPAMGAKASASMGAVVAHHTAPLSHVLRQTREAERRAKNAGRDAFSLRVAKRGGGAVDVTASFHLRGDACGESPPLRSTPAG